MLHGTSKNPIDLTNSHSNSSKPTDLLKSVSKKYLKFAEDVRPPYIGTYTKAPKALSKITRNPFTRALPSTNYDYDSEVEWEDPGEGEDLDSEGDEEVDEDEGDDLDDFLDDDAADARAAKRRLIVGDLQPVSSGLCWEGESPSEELNEYKLEVIHGE